MAASAAGALLALAVTGWLAVVWRIEGWNSAGQTNLEADSLGEAVRGLAAAERVCEFIPLFLERCQAVRMNLAISYRSLKRYDDSVRRFTDVIAVVGTPGPADRDNRVLLADALWGRSISRILLAEEARDDPDRSEQYRLADTDFDQSLALFDEMPDEAAKRPLDVTKARLLIADGAYDEARQALSHWTDANYSDQWLLIQSLALACLGDARQANQLYADYSAQFPDGSTDPRFTRTVSYYNNVRTRCNQH